MQKVQKSFRRLVSDQKFPTSGLQNALCLKLRGAHQVCPRVRVRPVPDPAGQDDGAGADQVRCAVAVEVRQPAREGEVRQGDVVVQGPQDGACKHGSEEQ